MEQDARRLTSSISGGDINLVYYKLGPKSKKRGGIYIQGGVHGGEATYWIFYSLARELKKAKIHQRITLLPISNPYAWMQKAYAYTFGKFSLSDGKDFNRNFPGGKDGTSAERLANSITKEADTHDIVVDLHTANASKPYGIVGNKSYIPALKKLGIAYNLLLDFGVHTHGQNTSFTASFLGKKESFAIECGSHDSLQWENVNTVVEGLLRYMRSKKIISGLSLPQDNKEQFIVDEFKIYYAPVSGFVEYLHPFETKIKKGQPLCRIYQSNSLGKVHTVKADEDCVIIMAARTHILWEGDYCIEVAQANRIKSI